MKEVIQGISFPFRIDGGRVAMSSGSDKLAENIAQILATNVGERVMQRDYGAGLRQLVHEPADDALRTVLVHQVAKAVARLEPRVLVQSVTIAREEAGGAELHVALRYMVRRTGQSAELRVPVWAGGTAGAGRLA